MLELISRKSMISILRSLTAFTFIFPLLLHAQEVNDKPGKLYCIKQGGKYGYIDARGNVVIKPQFVQAFGFSEGLAAVKVQDGTRLKWGYIDTTGKVIIGPGDWDDVSTFSEGLALVIRAESTVSMNVLGVNASQIHGKYGFISRKGDYVIQPQYSTGKSNTIQLGFKGNRSFSDGRAVVEVDGKYGYIDKIGKVVIDLKYNYAMKFSGGLARVGSESGTFYINTSGDYVIKPEFVIEETDDFSDGLARVKSGGKWGFINKEGKWAIEPQFHYAVNFSEGLAACCRNEEDKVCFINKKGETVIETPFDFAYMFSEGLAQVTNWSPYRHGYINTKGDLVIGLQFKSGSLFSNGLAVVETESQTGLIDKTGKFVWVAPK